MIAEFHCRSLFLFEDCLSAIGVLRIGFMNPRAAETNRYRVAAID